MTRPSGGAGTSWRRRRKSEGEAVCDILPHLDPRRPTTIPYTIGNTSLTILTRTRTKIPFVSFGAEIDPKSPHFPSL